MIQSRQRGLRPKRPRSVTSTAWGVILLGTANGWRALGLFRRLDLLLSLGAQPDPRLRLVLALIWAAVFVALALAVWRRWAPVRWLLPVVLVVYALIELTVSVFLARTTVTRQGWPALVALATVIILAIIWSLNGRAARVYFAGEEEEYGKSQN